MGLGEETVEASVSTALGPSTVQPQELGGKREKGQYSTSCKPMNAAEKKNEAKKFSLKTQKLKHQFLPIVAS